MTTRIFHDLLDHTITFLVVKDKLTSMTCRWGGKNRRQLKVLDKFPPRVGDMNFAQDHKPLGKTRNNLTKQRSSRR